MSSSDANRMNRLLLAGVLAVMVAVLALLWYRARHPAVVTPPPPDMPAVLRANNLGVGAMEQFRFKDAADAFDKVIAEGPDWLPGHINRGIALLNQGGSEGAESEATRQARAIFEDVLRRDANNPHAHYCLGIILTYQNQLAEALPHFEAVTKADPTDAHAWFRLGDAYRSLGKDTEAQDCFRKAVERDPYLSAAIYGLGMYLRESDPKRQRNCSINRRRCKRSGTPRASATRRWAVRRRDRPDARGSPASAAAAVRATSASR